MQLPTANKSDIHLHKPLARHFFRIFVMGLRHAACASYNIIIVGGGMVGSALACAIASNPFLSHQKVLLLESAPRLCETKVDGEFCQRVSAISPGSKRLLQDIGVWPSNANGDEKISYIRSYPVKRMQVWENCSDAIINFEGGIIADIIKNDVLIKALQSYLRNRCAGVVDVRYDTRLVEANCEHTRLQLSDGSDVEGDLIIGADGSNSFVRSKLMTSKEAPYLQYDYQQTAIVATLEIESDNKDNDTAWQRFVSPHGPIALLPLSPNVSSLVWTLPSSMADQYLKSNDAILEGINRAFSEPKEAGFSVWSGLNFAWQTILPRSSILQRRFPPTVTSVKCSAGFPLSLGHASRYVDRNVVLVGDAAHKVHPLAGQGVNLGLGDVSLLVSKLAEAKNDGAGSAWNYLLEYESERQKQAVTILGAVHLLNQLYSTKWLPCVLVRSLGVQTVNSSSYIKQAIMAVASA